MKTLKILFLGISLVLISCTGGEYFDGNDVITKSVEDLFDSFDDVFDDSQYYDNKTYFNPPEWIIGTWYYENDAYLGLRFTDSNVYEFWFTITTSKNKVLNYIENGEKKYSLYEETATDSTYYFRITNNFDSNYFKDYVYQKVSNDSLIHTYSDHNDKHFTSKYFRVE